MTASETTVSYQRIIDWGGDRFVNERLIRRWFGERESVTLDEVFTAEIEPRILYWVLIREAFMSQNSMHQAAVRFCRDFLDRLASSGVYVDFRCRQALDAKEAWLKREISLGALRVVQDLASRALREIVWLGDERARLAVQCTWQAVNDHGETALKSVLNTIHQAGSDLELRKTLLAQLRDHLDFD